MALYGLSIDVGINALGWALWNAESWKECIAPIETGIIRVGRNKGIGWEIKLQRVSSQLNDNLIVPHRPKYLALEYPELWSGSAKSHAAAKHDGGLLELAYACGVHAADARRNGAKKIILIRPTAWKGQMPKIIAARRIRRAFPSSEVVQETESHAMDAIGIGLAAKGYPLDNRRFL